MKQKDNTIRNIFILFGTLFFVLVVSVILASVYDDLILLPMYVVAGIAIIGILRRLIMMGLKHKKKRSKIDDYFDCI